MMSFHNHMTNVLPLIGKHTDGVELIKQGNDVFRLSSGAEHFFLKTYTKDWYGSDPATTGFHVIHESIAWAILAQQGLAVPTVAYAAPDCENPISRPFLLTHELEGRRLTDWLMEADRETQFTLLTVVGDYLRQMHKITFGFPGYLSTLSGPTESPDPAGWQHRCWSAKTRQAEAWKQLQGDEAHLTEATRTESQQACSQISSRLMEAYDPPRFTHGDCHAHQFFLMQNRAGWQVTGVVDMEVSSAGDSGEDLLKIILELGQRLDHKTCWWEALFAGYETAPDLEAFRLRLLGVAPREYGIGNWIQTPSREAMLRRLLQARDWSSLFEPIV
jgi:aminoglycoside phosphotransferase (APT) family kinase protein